MNPAASVFKADRGMMTGLRRLACWAVSLMTALGAGSAPAAVRCVNVARPDDQGDGLSWVGAHQSLQTALAAAQPGDEIWVAAGIYKPSDSLDRTVSFALKSGVAIYGGFSGVESSR